ncbi:PAS domain-containing protein [Arcobacter sp. YIC-464]|uniref:PAS domain-containing protein n=1 Tax=Arcobacter sp. YIC-464 TaxID=3376631 RepID=UPI003C1DF4B0
MSNVNEILKLSQKLNILYVEDDEILRSETAKLLKYFFANVITAQDGIEGIEKFKTNQIDIIMSDICMPKLDGLQMIKEIKKSNPNIPTIINSAFNEVSYLHESINLKIDEYLIKPLNLEKLKESLNKTINKLILQRKSLLLNNYEEAIIKNSILTKLDSHGNFIYVNDKFNELFRYRKGELLNRSFIEILKNDSSSFKSLLKKIELTKEPWHGQLKCKKRNNKKVWLKINITPIYDEEDVLKEFLILCIDITEEVSLKKYLKKELSQTKYNLKNAMKLTSQYEMAINESSILTKTNLKGKITFVNEKFCDISGYSEEELIGKPHNLIRHPEMSSSVFKELWETIKVGKCWQGIIKNRKKDGSDYWVSTTIIPIKNKKNEIKEYISIRHDLTKVFELHEEIEETQRELVYKLGEVGETRSKETGNHVKRVAQYSRDLALLYGLSKAECDILFAASPMHDIGKVGIPDEILKKPGKLTTEEFDIMKSHCNIGFNILKGSQRPVLKAAAIIANEHHEKYDGSGYPKGLKGQEIHIFGRITALADVFDALGSDRYYKKAWEDEKIFNLIREEKGKHFDPILVDLFMDNIEIFLNTRDKYTDK